MTSLIPFDYSGRQVRTVQVDGEPWFVAADVCAALDIANVSNALARLDEDEKGSIRLAEGTSGNPNRSIVNESGVYTLILRSDKPEAKPFKRWVTHEVLPSIRRDGGYINPVATADQLNELRKRAEVLQALTGFVDPGFLDAKGRILAAQALGETPELDQATKPLTVSIYLARKGLKGKEAKAAAPMFGKRLKALYVQEFGAEPPSIEDVVGRHVVNVAQYQEQHSRLFDQIWTQCYGGAA